MMGAKLAFLIGGSDAYEIEMQDFEERVIDTVECKTRYSHTASLQ